MASSKISVITTEKDKNKVIKSVTLVKLNEEQTDKLITFLKNDKELAKQL